MSTTLTTDKREVRRSFALGVTNGALFRFAETLVDPPLVLTWFVSQLTASNLLIGLVMPLGEAGWFLLQIFVSPRVQRMKRKMPSYTVAAVIRTASWLLLATGVWLVSDPKLLLVVFFLLYTIARFSCGLSGLAFFDVIAKTIPPRRRGSLFAWRQLLGGILGLGGGWIVNVVLNNPNLPFPRGHALLFFMYCGVFAVAMAAFIMIREPPGVAVKESVTLMEQFRRAGGLLRRDPVYRRYTVALLSMALATMALPFYGIYAKRVLGAPDGMVGLYVTARVAAMLLFNLPWGHVSDRWGNRLVMRLAALGNGLNALLALVLIALVTAFRPQGAWLPYLALPLFLLEGAMRPAQVMFGNVFLLELVPEEGRMLYMGLSNTLAGIVYLLSGLGGLLVDLSGFVGLFAVSVGLRLVAYVMATGLPEPRSAEA
jgi:MFS family permease